MCSDKHVPEVESFIQGGSRANPSGKILDARFSKFQTHHSRNRTTDNAGNNCENQVKCTDVLVVGGHEPTLEKGRFMVCVMCMIVQNLAVCCNSCHRLLPLSSQRRPHQPARLELSCQWMR